MSGFCPNHGPYDGNTCPYPPPHGSEERVKDIPKPHLPKVFLCHASADKPAVRDLYKRLIADGVEAWFDTENLMPGQNWQMEIPKAIRDSDVVIVCLSENSINKEGFVQKEIKFALDIADQKPEGAIFVIPALLTSCKIPESMSKWHGVNLFEENGYKRLLLSLRLNAGILETNLQIKNATRLGGFCPEHGPYDGFSCPYSHEIGEARTNIRSRLLDVLDDDDGEEPTEIPTSRQRNYAEDEDLDNTQRDSQKSLCLLCIASGRRRGRTYQITDGIIDGIIVGRRDCDLVLDDGKVSRQHAKFQMQRDKFFVWDLGSSNGTYVNNKKIREQTLIVENDLLRIGDTVFIVKILLPLYKHKNIRKSNPGKAKS